MKHRDERKEKEHGGSKFCVGGWGLRRAVGHLACANLRESFLV